MDITETWIDGVKVFGNDKVLFDYAGATAINNFKTSEIKIQDLAVIADGRKLKVIEAFDGDLKTSEKTVAVNRGEHVRVNLGSDILKIVVKDRYRNLPVAVGFIKGFGLKSGAFASSVAHDSHNIISVGTTDYDIVNAVNEVIKMKGGLAVADGNYKSSLSLPVAGIMSDQPVEEVASAYEQLSEKVRSCGCKMSAPFMTLSFMALLVIPELKLSDQGLFSVREFKIVPLFED
jgi:adenine deaminase